MARRSLPLHASARCAINAGNRHQMHNVWGDGPVQSPGDQDNCQRGKAKPHPRVQPVRPRGRSRPGSAEPRPVHRGGSRTLCNQCRKPASNAQRVRERPGQSAGDEGDCEGRKAKPHPRVQPVRPRGRSRPGSAEPRPVHSGGSMARAIKNSQRSGRLMARAIKNSQRSVRLMARAIKNSNARFG